MVFNSVHYCEDFTRRGLLELGVPEVYGCFRHVAAPLEADSGQELSIGAGKIGPTPPSDMARLDIL